MSVEHRHCSTRNQGDQDTPQLQLQSLIPVWTTWGRWSHCSFTCGQGIRSRERVCVARTDRRLVRVADERACPGSSAHHDICSVEKCKVVTDRRASQCQSHDGDVIQGQSYTWIPFYGGNNPCSLSCIAKGFNFYYQFGNTIDGTTCNHGNQVGVCLKGTCQTIGCDGAIGSAAEMDNCLVCGGENKQCAHYKSVYLHKLKPDDKLAYKHIITIPPGATRVNFTEVGRNYLALADLDGVYLLNGRWKIHWPGRIQAGNTTMFYSRHRHREEITIPGPTHESLKVMLMMTEREGRVSYDFHLPSEQLDNIGYPTIPTPQDDDVIPRRYSNQWETHTSPLPTRETVERVAKVDSEHLPACKKCTSAKGFVRNFCSSEIVLHVGVRNVKKTKDGVIYDVIVLKTYKSNVTLGKRAFIKVTDICQCPRLKENREYVVMTTMNHHLLEMDAKSFVRSYRKNVEKKLRRVHCEKYDNDK